MNLRMKMDTLKVGMTHVQEWEVNEKRLLSLASG